MKRHLLKSLRLTVISTAVALISIGQPISFVFLKSSPNGTSVYAAEKESKDNSEIANIAKKITVRIEGAGNSGSGVIVKKEGTRYTILTAWHVVKDNLPHEEVGIITSDGKEHLWDQKSMLRLGKVDMAVLTFTSKKKYKVAIIGDSKKVKYQDQVYVAGFPLFDLGNLKLESGEVVANAEISIDQGYQLLYTNQTKKGMSGGVILNKNGELIGLHGRGEIDRKKKKEEVISKTGINQGVPISFYKQFLNGSPVEVPNNKPNTADDYLAMAWSSQDKVGRDQTVIRLLNEALEINEDFPQAYFLLAYTNFNLKDYPSAIKNYTKAIKLDPANNNSYLNRGISKHFLGDYIGAIRDFNKSLQIDPDFGDTYISRASSKIELGMHEEAMLDYKMAIKLEPNNSDHYYNRGTDKHDLGDYQGALNDYTKAIEINPKDSDAIYNRALVNDSLGKINDSLNDYNVFIEMNPLNGVAYANRGLIKGKLGDEEGLCLDAKRAASLGEQITKKYLSSEEGAWCRNMPD